MCCSDCCAQLGVEALRWVGDVVSRCLLPGEYKPLRIQNRVREMGYGVKNSTTATAEFADYDELLSSNIILNPEFSEGITGWSGVQCSLSVLNYHETSYCVASGRTERSQGFAQEIGKRLDANVVYRAEVWVGIRGGLANQAQVLATVKVETSSGNGASQYILLGSKEIRKGEWCLLTGTLQLSEPPHNATLYVNGPDGGVDLLVSSVALIQTSTTLPNVEVPKRTNPLQIVDVKQSKEVVLPPVLDASKLGVNIIANSTLNNGLHGWYAMGNCSLNIVSGGPRFVSPTVQKSFVNSRAPTLSGKYILCSSRNEIWEGPAQDITNQIELYQSYQVFAWVATTLPLGNSSSSQKVNVALDVDGQWMQGGEILAGSEWTEISGSFRLETKPEKVVVYLQGPAAGVDIKLAGLQIFAVDRLARVPLLQQKADKIRKRKTVLKLRDFEGRLLPPGTKVFVQQVRNSFPIGTSINHESLQNVAYRNFLVDNFNWAVFDYELKWDQTEAQQGQVDYRRPDAMVRFCNENDITMRGHCIVWGEEQYMQSWVKELEGELLVNAVQDRVASLLQRYRGQFQHYDVDNELLHSSFYQDRLGMDFLPYLFNLTHQYDPDAALFVNDCHISDGSDCMSSPERYRDLVKNLVENGASVGGIGVQGHVQVPIGPIVSRALDILSTVNIPIWFTEVDTPSLNEHVRADDLEVMFREAFAHPAVEGFLLWGFMENAMSNPNCHLVDSDNRINAAGQRLMALQDEWTTHVEGIVDNNGEITFRGFHGDYNISLLQNSVNKSFEVAKGDGPLLVDISI